MNQDTQRVVVDALTFAQGVADDAGECLLGSFGGVRDVKVKGDGTLVTQADLEADRLIADAIQQRYKVWDMAVGWLLVHEAGGVVVPLEGDPMFPLVAGRDYGTIVRPPLSAPNMAIARELKERIKRRSR